MLEVEDEIAREKISHALRSAKKPAEKKPRKKRKTVEIAYKEEEEKVFAKLLDDQQRMLLTGDPRNHVVYKFVMSGYVDESDIAIVNVGEA